MKKGFLITGIAFLACFTIVVALNYVAYSQRISDASSVERMGIDRVNNRAIDVYRVINSSAADAKLDSGCSVISARVSAVLDQSKSMLLEEGITLSYTVNPIAACGVNVNYSLDSPHMHKEVVFTGSY